MNTSNKEKLIEIVRKHECIYMQTNKDYKNIAYKTLLWEKIGAKLGIEGGKAKELWRSLRDGYMRHKRTVRRKTGESRKYSHYTWSSQMAFLDGTLELRPTSTHITSQQADFDPLRTTSPSPSSLDQPGPSQFYPDPKVDDDSSLSESQDLTFTQSHESPTRPQSLPSSATHTPRTVTKKKKTSDRGEETEKILNYLRNKKRKEWDSVDHLFMSYAKSFKQLTLQDQAKLKVTLAKLFAGVELENNLKNEPANQTSRLIYSSSAYSEASNQSAETIND